MAGGRGVEHHVRVRGRRAVRGQEVGKLIERGYFHGASAGELLLHPGDGIVREYAPKGPDHPLAVCACRRFGVDVDSRQARHAGDRGGVAPDRDTEHLIEIRRGIGADQEDAVPRISEGDGGGASV